MIKARGHIGLRAFILLLLGKIPTRNIALGKSIIAKVKTTMKTATAQYLPATSAAHNLPVFPPLEQVTRPTVPTDQAAYYVNRQPQTLRSWASLENGALRPIRINGRLAWKVSDIKSLLNGECAQ